MKKLICAALTLAAISAHATDYIVVVPVPGRAAAAPAPAPITVALNSTALPEGVEGAAYGGFDFSQVLQVKGDPAFNPSSVSWQLSAGTLPAGLTLSASGVLAGTPTAAAVTDFAVRATYQSRTAEQGYQLVVKGDADPHWSKVRYLFNFEGASGAKALSEPTKGAAGTFAGAAQLTSNIARFGSTSLSVVGGYVQLPGDVMATGAADFTYETHVKADKLGAQAMQLLDCRPGSSNGPWLTLGVYPSGAVSWYASANEFLSAPGTIPDTGWHHLAYSRVNGVGRLFVDGRLVGSYADKHNYQASSACFIGKNSFGVALSGVYVDALRVTNGVGRYTADFTAPQRAYPTN